LNTRAWGQGRYNLEIKSKTEGCERTLRSKVGVGEQTFIIWVMFFFPRLGFELRAYTLNHSTSCPTPVFSCDRFFSR
jgi:hypothetical protein